jgi:sensor domain CHASE-containing protein
MECFTRGINSNKDLFPFSVEVIGNNISISVECGFEMWCMKNDRMDLLKRVCDDVFNIVREYLHYQITGNLITLIEEDISRWNREHDFARDRWYDLKQGYFQYIGVK